MKLIDTCGVFFLGQSRISLDLHIYPLLHLTNEAYFSSVTLLCKRAGHITTKRITVGYFHRTLAEEKVAEGSKEIAAVHRTKLL